MIVKNFDCNSNGKSYLSIIQAIKMLNGTTNQGFRTERIFGNTQNKVSVYIIDCDLFFALPESRNQKSNNFAQQFLRANTKTVRLLQSGFKTNYRIPMSKGIITIILLILSNTFMTFAWYGHLKFKEIHWLQHLGLFSIILISWGIAFFEYIFQVPANKIGFAENGGPFNIWQLKVIQEVITLVVFTVFTLTVFKTETFRLNHVIGFVFLILAVYFIFKK
jgi:uncharacterized protein (DUF486 family)